MDSIDNQRITASPSAALTAMDKVDNGLVIAFHCDTGYNIQGPGNLRCWNGDWAVSSQPECLPSPCVLPPIVNAIYQGGYRSGLTIAHSSSVMVQCETGKGTTPAVQMDCALGALTPQTINCALTSRKSREDDVANVIVEGGNYTSMEEADGKEW